MEIQQIKERIKQPLTILFTNDPHGNTSQEPKVKRLYDQLNEINENAIILSAGDVFHGAALATLSRGESIVKIMNSVGYHAMVPGNHDFNYGINHLLELQKQLNFPMLACNIVYSNSNQLVFEPYIMINVGELKVGVFGVATPWSKTNLAAHNESRLIEFTDMVKSSQMAVNALRAENVDYVIALSHLGLVRANIEKTEFVSKKELDENLSTILAKEVTGIDFIIDGHNHFSRQAEINNTKIVLAGANCENIGITKIIPDGETSISLIHKNMSLPISPEIQDIISQEENKFVVPLRSILCNIQIRLDETKSKQSETNLGSCITDALRYTTKADIALINGGAISKSIEAGDVTTENLFNVMPFGNKLVTTRIAGLNIIKALEWAIEKYPNRSQTLLHVSGLILKFDPNQPKGKRILEVRLITGELIQPYKLYLVASSDYLLNGNDGFHMLKTNNDLSVHGTLFETFQVFFKSLSPDCLKLYRREKGNGRIKLVEDQDFKEISCITKYDHGHKGTPVENKNSIEHKKIETSFER